MRNRPWTMDEIDDAHRLGDDVFLAKYPDRTPNGLRFKRARTHPSPSERTFRSDKKLGDLDFWRACDLLQEMQEFRAEASYSQHTADIALDDETDVCVVGISDAHFASWGTDHGLVKEVTAEILETPHLYIAVLGDMEQMAINITQGVLALSDNMLPPELQHRMTEAWLELVAPKVVFATWDNHSVERAEKGSGFSGYADLMKRRVIYHSGIGHPDVRLGDQVYKFAVSHFFRGRSATNPCHGIYKYLTGDGHTREIGMAGDSHVPGLLHFFHGPTAKLALNGGTMQINSGYAQRYYSLTTHPQFPCVVLSPHAHEFVGLPSVRDWVRMRG